MPSAGRLEELDALVRLAGFAAQGDPFGAGESTAAMDHPPAGAGGQPGQGDGPPSSAFQLTTAVQCSATQGQIEPVRW